MVKLVLFVLNIKLFLKDSSVLKRLMNKQKCMYVHFKQIDLL